jgi:hypothetical protein
MLIPLYERRNVSKYCKKVSIADLALWIEEGRIEPKIEWNGDKVTYPTTNDASFTSISENTLYFHKDMRANVDLIDECKKKLPLFISAVITKPDGKSNSDIISYTGMMTLDIDFEIEQDPGTIEEIKHTIFNSDRSVLLAFRSPSKGIKLVINIGETRDITHYSNMFKNVKRYFEAKYNITVDSSGSDPVRGCFMSFDETVQFRCLDESEPFEMSQTNEIVHNSDSYIIDEFCSEIMSLPERKKNGQTTSNHDELLKILIKAKEVARKRELDIEHVRNKLLLTWNQINGHKKEKESDFIRAWDNAPEKTQKENYVMLHENSWSISDYLYYKEREPYSTLLTVDIENHPAVFLQKGSISTIIASPGSGKTSLVSSIFASILFPHCESIVIKPTENVKSVLYIDTENHSYSMNKIVDGIITRAGDISFLDLLNPEKNGVIVSLQELIHKNSDAKRKGSISLIDSLEKSFKKRRYDLVIIDDSSPLTSDILNLTDSEDVLSSLSRIALSYDTGFILSVHSNSGQEGSKARGHWGSSMERKSQTVCHLVRDNSIGITQVTFSTTTAKLRHGDRFGAMREEMLAKGKRAFIYDKELRYHRECTEEDINNLTDNLVRAPKRTQANQRVLEFITEYVNNALSQSQDVLSNDIMTETIKNINGMTDNRFYKLFKTWKSENEGKYKFSLLKQNRTMISKKS